MHTLANLCSASWSASAAVTTLDGARSRSRVRVSVCRSCAATTALWSRVRSSSVGETPDASVRQARFCLKLASRNVTKVSIRASRVHLFSSRRPDTYRLIAARTAARPAAPAVTAPITFIVPAKGGRHAGGHQTSSRSAPSFTTTTGSLITLATSSRNLLLVTNHSRPALLAMRLWSAASRRRRTGPFISAQEPHEQSDRSTQVRVPQLAFSPGMPGQVRTFHDLDRDGANGE